VEHFAKFDWLVKAEVQDAPETFSRSKRPKRDRTFKVETPSDPSAMRKKQKLAGSASHPIEVADDGANDEIVVRGWEADIAADHLQLENDIDKATMTICNSIEKKASNERLKSFDCFKTYEVKDGATVTWSLIILAVGVCRQSKSSRACALMIAQNDMQGSKWGAPFWIGANRLVGPEAKMVSWPSVPRPTCKLYDNELKVKKLLQSSSITTHFREQGFIQNMLPQCQATPPKPSTAKSDSKQTPAKPDSNSKNKAGKSKSSSASEDIASGVTNLLALLGKPAEGAANSLGELQPYNPQALAASSYAPGQGSGSDIQNQFNLFMIGQQRETQSQLLQMQQQQQSMPNANVRGEQLTVKDLLNMQQATVEANAQATQWQQQQLALAQDRTFTLLDKFAAASTHLIQVHSHAKQTQWLLQTSR
jgi:hypothetical protein